MSHAPAPSTATDRHHPLINRDFALLWSGQIVTDLGTVVFNTALVLWVAAELARGRSWAPLAVSGVLLAQALPQVVVRPLAGVFVDRWDTRRTMLLMDALRVGLVALLIVPALTPMLPFSWRLGALYVAVLLVGACAQFFNSALLALLGDLVPEGELARASGLSEVTWNTAAVLGPPLAAPLVLGWGITWALALNALTFLVSLLTLLVLRVPRHVRERIAASAAVTQPNRIPRLAPARVFAELGEGARFVAGSRVARTVTLAVTLAMLGAGALRALDYFFVTETLHTAPVLYGLVGPAFGGGSVVGALLAGRLAPRLGVARAFALALLGVGLALVMLSRQTSLAPALAIWALLGIVNSATNVTLVPLLLGATPRALVGRMNALFFTAIGVAGLLSSTLAGWLVSALPRGFALAVLGPRIGAVDGVLLAGGLVVCLAGLYAARSLWGMERERSV